MPAALPRPGDALLGSSPQQSLGEVLEASTSDSD
jgi:hypothetical protein